MSAVPLINVPLTLTQMREYAPTAYIMKYSGLQKFDKLPPLPLILLYETEPNHGHWVAIVNTPDGIEHFDSYGILPDGELRWVPADLKKQTGQDVKRLLGMLYESGQKINYNDYKLQGKDTATCGRWCALRILFHKLTNQEFAQLVSDVSGTCGLTPDEMVSRAVSIHG